MTNPMNPHTPPPPLEPLDDDERQLARALGGLPSSMPPPELDARILGASRRAIAIAPKPRTHGRGWVWGLSTAAAAVLAVGVLLKMHTQGRDQMIAPVAQAPVAAEPVASPVGIGPSANATAAGAMSADMETARPITTTDAALKAPAEPTSGAPASAEMRAAKSTDSMREPAQKERDELQAAKPATPTPSTFGTVAPLDKSAASQGAASPAAPQPFPMTSGVPAPPTQAMNPEGKREAAPPTPPVATDRPNFISASAPPSAAAAAKAQPKPTQNAQPQAAQSLEAGGAADAREKDAALDSIQVTGNRVRRASDSVVLPPLDDDSKLSSAQWIERIRARVNAADGVTARESLRRYIARYPNAQIPADLAPLR